MESTTTLIVLKELYGNEPTSLGTLQLLVAPHVEILSLLWLAVWCATLAFLVRYAYREYKAQKQQ